MEKHETARIRPDELLSTAKERSVLAVVERLYDAAEHPDRMREALAAVADLAGAGSAMLVIANGGERSLLAASHAPGRGAGSGVARSPGGAATRTVPLPGGFELVFDRVDEEPQTLASIAALTPHLIRALHLAERLGARTSTHHWKLSDLDRLPIGALLIGSDGEALAINRAARSVLSSATSIQLSARRLEPRAPGPRAMVETLIERLVAPPEPGRRFVGGRFHFTDETWGEVDLLLTRFDTRCENETVHAVAVVSATGAAISPEERLRSLFALDAEETALAVDLILGREPGSPAEKEAARDRIRSLYEKLGTTRQTDLVRLLLRPPGVVFEAAERARSY